MFLNALMVSSEGYRVGARQAFNRRQQTDVLRALTRDIEIVDPDPMYGPAVCRMYGPAVCRKGFLRVGVSGLASMYPASDWSGSVLRAIMDISARSFSLADRPHVGH